MDETTANPPTDKGAASVFVKGAPTEQTDSNDSDAIKKTNSQKNEASDGESNDIVIVTGADVSAHLIPIRDDFDEALTLRSIVLATILAGFQAVMNQIYTYKPSSASMTTTFIVLISYFLGVLWAKIFPRGDRMEDKWLLEGNRGKLPLWIKLWKIVNPREWSLKEHAICAITASSASNGTASVSVFAAQTLFYDLPISTTTVILSVLSIGLFGYGLTGIIRPIAVWHPEAVYWTNLPVVKTLQSLHWENLAASRPLRYFWVAFCSMAVWEVFPAYIFPWLNSISIPCLASQKAKGEKAKVLTNLFGGATNNEGLGMFSISLDYQYITSSSLTYPLTLQVHEALGIFVCMMAMIGIYYGNVWDSLSQPFMSTRLHQSNGSTYPLSKVFPGGVLNEGMLEKYGLPRLTGSFAYAILMANTAIGGLVAHCILFWGKDIVHSFKNAMKGQHDDPHHRHMATHYKEAPWWWYASMLVFSFVLGLVVVIKENITLPPWAYVVSLLLGIALAPFSIILFSRFGNGIATNNLSKMLAGLTIPGRPIGNMYFAAWSHNVISNSLNLAADLKMGEYLKISPRVMFLTQIYGTVLGAFVNYGIMVLIVTKYRDLLVEGNGNSAWSGAAIQSYNTAATSWALAPWLFKAGKQYEMVPIGMAIGAGAVTIHWIFYKFKPKIGNFNIDDINLPQFIQYAGYIPYNQNQTCIILSSLLAGFWAQFYVRNYHPRFFKDYMYLIASAMDGGFFFVLFILSFAVLGVGSALRPFPAWWGNNVNGTYDWCPVAK